MLIRAVIFDLDGVLVETAGLHARAWKRAFDRVLDDRDAGPPFDPDEDYRRHVDGKPRYDGARDFLASRGIDLPRGDPDDAPGTGTVCAVGNLKNQEYHRLLDEQGVTVLPGAGELVDGLRAAGVDVAVVSSSRNAATVLEASGLGDRIPVLVDGTDLAAGGMAGKPDPAMFLEAADRLGVAPRHAAVVEDAAAGVEAGRRGGFGLVVGVEDRGAERLAEHGADLVVPGPGALGPDPGRWEDEHGTHATREESS